MNFRFKQEDDSGINLTPLIDIVFLLLIFFMVTTTFNSTEMLDIRLPSANTSLNNETEEDVARLMIDSGGNYYIDGYNLPVVNLKSLLLALRSTGGINDSSQLIIHADARTPHEYVIMAIDAASKLGITHVMIATTHQDMD